MNRIGWSFRVAAVCVAAQLHAGIPQSRGQSEPGESTIRDTVETIAQVVNREYFDREMASRVAEGLVERLRSGQYADVQTHEQLAEVLTEDLREITKDKHLSVSHISPDDATRVSPEARQQARETRARRKNYGVQHIQILPGNVGYLNLTFFYRPAEARQAIESAMETLRHSDALILDMRSNQGGNPGTVALLASYLFEEPGKLLFEIVPREGETKSYHTESPAVMYRDGEKPVYVLTAATTFSAGEGFAYLLQEQKRAEVVGEVTAGAANPGRGYPVNTRFEVGVPNGQVRSAVRARNWEGTGVAPDIRVPADAALPTAHARALEESLQSTDDPRWAETLRQELARISGAS